MNTAIAIGDADSMLQTPGLYLVHKSNRRYLASGTRPNLWLQFIPTVLIVAGLSWLIVSAFDVLFGGTFYLELRNQGISTTGTLLEKHVEQNCRGCPHYVFVLSYNTVEDTNTYTLRRTLSERIYATYELNSIIPVTYSSLDPQRAALTQQVREYDFFARNVVRLYAFAMMFVIAIAKPYFDTVERGWLWREGKLIPTKLLDVQPSRYSGSFYELTYDVDLPTGKKRGHESFLKLTLTRFGRRTLPKPGAFVILLYTNDSLLKLL